MNTLKSKIFLFFFLNFLIGTAFSQQILDENTKVGTINQKDILVKDLKNQDIQKKLEELYKLLRYGFEKKALEGKEFSSPEISEIEIKKFYEENNLQARGSYNDLKQQIKNHLINQNKRNSAKNELTKLYDQKQVSFLLEYPPTFIVNAPLRNAYLQGKKDADVVVLEFSDYQCPFCKKNQPVIVNLIKKYKDKVAFGYRHYPLSFHKEADEASLAVECARDQGKFSEYHGILFNQKNNKWSIAQLKSYAKTIEIPQLDVFAKCLDSKKYQNLLTQDIKDAEIIGIKSTPTYVIGKRTKDNIIKGELVVGALPEATIEKIIKKYL